MTLFIADGSHYQVGLPIADLPRQGFAALIWKATEGTGWTDGSFARAVATAQRAGLLVAAYHFLTPADDAHLKAQAAHCASVVPPDIPVWIDVEGGSTRAQAYVFADALRQAGRRVAGIYHGAQPAPGYGGWWRAGYFADPHGYASVAYEAQGGDGGEGWRPGVGRHPDLWQFCQHGRVAGFSGDVDFSAWRGSLTDLANTGWWWVPPALREELDMPTLDDIREVVREEVEQRCPDVDWLTRMVDLHVAAAIRDAPSLKALAGLVATIAAAPPVDAPAVDVAALAQQISASLPDDLAQHLVDVLVERLGR